MLPSATSRGQERWSSARCRQQNRQPRCLLPACSVRPCGPAAACPSSIQCTHTLPPSCSFQFRQCKLGRSFSSTGKAGVGLDSGNPLRSHQKRKAPGASLSLAGCPCAGGRVEGRNFHLRKETACRGLQARRPFPTAGDARGAPRANTRLRFSAEGSAEAAVLANLSARPGGNRPRFTPGLPFLKLQYEILFQSVLNYQYLNGLAVLGLPF